MIAATQEMIAFKLLYIQSHEKMRSLNINGSFSSTKLAFGIRNIVLNPHNYLLFMLCNNKQSSSLYTMFSTKEYYGLVGIASR